MAQVTFAEMRSKLMPVNDLRTALQASEPLSEYRLGAGFHEVQFDLASDLPDVISDVRGDDLVPAYIHGVGPERIQLTKDAFLESTSLCGLPKGYVERTPSFLTVPQLNYWFGSGFNLLQSPKAFKLLTSQTSGGPVGSAFIRSTLQPFSTLRMLDEAVEAVQTRYGSEEIFVDPKFHHAVNRTHMRLLIPGQSRNITSAKATTEDPDVWNIGLQVKNSLTGASQTSIDGYLFRWWCTNGAVHKTSATGTWNRKTGGQDPDSVYEWARSTVDEVLGGLEGALDGVQALTEQPINGDVMDVLRDIFETYRVPAPLRQRVVANMAEEDDLSMYAVMQAITAVANDGELNPVHSEAMMSIGGDLVHAHSSRCTSCHRALVAVA